MHQNKNKHQPVLVEEAIRYLDPKPGESYLDLTAGYGGHAKAILARTLNPKKATLIDRDENAVKELAQIFDEQLVKLVHSDYLAASQELVQQRASFDLVLADLGVSSPHLDVASRGFSITTEGPLDMRMNRRQSLTAADIVNNYSEADLANLIRAYGEEPKAAKIASMIIAKRPMTTTIQLAEAVKMAWPGRSRIHPATRTFQALRIVVNDELGQLEKALPLWIKLLAPSGRIAVISFHSLEDRLVKQALAEESGQRFDAKLRLLTKRPVVAGPNEIVSNPRARSAKLRAAVKIKINQERGD